jgi:hypothetical protein
MRACHAVHERGHSAVPLLPLFLLLLLCLTTARGTTAASAAADTTGAAAPRDVADAATAAEVGAAAKADADAAAEAEAEAAALRDVDVCTLERLDARAFSVRLFFARYYNRRPFVLTNYSAALGPLSHISGSASNDVASRARAQHASFRARSSEEALLSSFGHERVLAATGSTYSSIRRSISFKDYVALQRSKPLMLTQNADDISYFFGDHDDPSNFDAEDIEREEQEAAAALAAAAARRDDDDDTQQCNESTVATATAIPSVSCAQQESSVCGGGDSTPASTPSSSSPSSSLPSRTVRPVWSRLLRHYPPPPFVLPHVLAEEMRGARVAAASSAESVGDGGGVQTHRLPSAAAQRLLFEQGDLDAAAAAAAAADVAAAAVKAAPSDGSASLPPRFDYLRYSFGLGGHRSGVPFHFHGGALAEVLHGRKRWWLFPPKVRSGSGSQQEQSPFDDDASSLPFPSFRPELSQLQWLATEYPSLSSSERPLQCTLGPQELLYVPAGFMHATTNLGPLSVFVSTFLDELRMDATIEALTGVDVHTIRREEEENEHQ